MANDGAPAGRVTYNRQYRRCNKDDCPACRAGAAGHGPYWYAYWREDGRLRSRYIGKVLPSGVSDSGPVAKIRELSAPAEVLPGLRVRTLGGFDVWRGTVRIPPQAWRQRKPLALFKCLVSAPENQVHRERAIETLWPNADPEISARNLRLTIHRLRKILGGDDQVAGYVRSEGQMLVLDPAPAAQPGADWLDVRAFEQGAAKAFAAGDIAACRAAISLYCGDYLPGDPYDEWAVARREELRQRFVDLLLHTATLLERQGNLDEAMKYLQALLAIDAYSEPATRALMRLHAFDGHHTSAVRVYRQLVLRLRDELAIEPDAETQALYRDLLTDKRRRPSTGAAAFTTRPTTAVPTPVQPRIAEFVKGMRLPIVGREREIGELEHELDTITGGHGRILLVQGSAGVGKSRLLSELSNRAEARRYLVLVGRAYTHEGQLPMGPLQEALRAYIAAQPPEVLKAQMSYHAVLARLVPDLGRALPQLAQTTTLETRAERHRLFAALAGLLRDIATNQPVVLILDDLHWADATTIQALHFLRRACSATKLLIAGSYRQEELPGPVGSARSSRDLAWLEPDTVLDLSPLLARDGLVLVTGLLGTKSVDEASAAAIVARAEGNPLFVVEIVSALRQEGHLRDDGGRWRLAGMGQYNTLSLPIPESLQAITLQRVQRLGKQVARLLRLCAVLGHRASYALLRMMVDGQEDRLLDAIEAALAARIIEEVAVDGQPGYQFTHQLIRESIYSSLTAQRRLGLHRRIAAAMELLYGVQRFERAAEIAYHFGKAGAVEKVVKYSIVAGDAAAAAYAGPEAVAHYLTARGHLEHVASAGCSDNGEGAGTIPPLVRVDEKLGDMRLLQGQYAQALEDYRRARAEAAEPTAIVALWCKEGVALQREGLYAEALEAYAGAEADFAARTAKAHLDGSAQQISQRMAACAADIELGRGDVYFYRWEYDAAATAARKALDLLAGQEDCASLARAHYLLCVVAVQQSDHATAEVHARASLAIWERTGDMQGVASVWNALGLVAADRDDYASAEDYHRRSLDIRTRIGDQRGMSVSWHNLGNVASDRGDFPTALDRYEESFHKCEELGDQGNIATALNSMGAVTLLLGDLDRAKDCYGKALVLRERLGNEAGIGLSRKGLADVALAAGDLDVAAKEYARALALLKQSGIPAYVAEAYVGLGSVFRQQCAPAQARRQLREARRLSRRIGAHRIEALAIAESAQVYLDAAAGRLPPRRCARLILHAKEIAATYGIVEAQLAALLVEAKLERLSGHRATAQTVAAEAARRALSLGMRRYAALATEEEARCLPSAPRSKRC